VTFGKGAGGGAVLLGGVALSHQVWSRISAAHPATAEPFDPGLDMTSRAVIAAMNNRLIVYPARFCADGASGDAFIVAPPLTATDEELSELLARLRATLVTLRSVLREAQPG
jgi:adenosylmethionine-8-amino-7-oxononanoate aminotransferase